MLDYCVGMIGTPTKPETEWTEERLVELKKMGFNAMQLNIAWGCRPNDEPLNIEDVLVLPNQILEERKKTEERRERIRKRLALCKKCGMRAIFHFGAPFNGLEPYQGIPPKNCFYEKEVVEKYCGFLDELNIQIPGIDDILVYTYDQDAWLCSEFSQCKNCRGIPLHNRLPEFLKALCEKWSAINHNGIMWWESWELSAGQVLRMIEELPTLQFGLMAHSNIGEVQKSRPVDLWFKNLCMLARERGIPVVAELFLGESSEETEPLKRIPCPRLTYTQIKAVTEIDGIVGIKEYYGLLPGSEDPCLEMVGECLIHPNSTLEKKMEAISQKYGEVSREMIVFWELIADAYMLYPWDVSWFAREVGRSSLDHGWHAAFLRGQQCSTPSWESSRHSVFMKVDDAQPHPWMLEDIQLRCELCSERLERAIVLGKEILKNIDERFRKQMCESLESIDELRKVCVTYSLHLRETNVAFLLRENKMKGEKMPQFLLQELEELLQRDVENQNNKGRVVDIKEEYQKNPYTWLDKYLIPTEKDIREKGYFSLTTR